MHVNERVVRQLFESISSGAVGEELRRFFDPEAEQVEHPSMFRPNGGRRGLEAMLEASHAGARLLRHQRYDVHEVVETGDRAAAQLTWRGATAVSLGDIPAGTELVAHVAAFFEFRDGRIVRQTSYDCYEPVGAVQDD